MVVCGVWDSGQGLAALPGVWRLRQAVMAARSVVVADPNGDPPTYWWTTAPAGLATVRQLRALGLRPNGQGPAAILLKPRSRVIAYLYEVTRAAPKRTATVAQHRAAMKALAARHICCECGLAAPYVVPKSTGRRCLDCGG